MAQIYDSAKVREAARAVRDLANELEAGVMGEGRRAARESEQLKGRAAESLEGRLEALNEEVKRISGDLESISRALNRYAATLEQVSEKLSSEMRQGR